MKQERLEQVFLTKPKITTDENFITVMEKEYIKQVKSLVSIAKENKELNTFKKFVKFLEVNRIVFKSKHLSTGNSLPGDNFEQDLLSKLDRKRVVKEYRDITYDVCIIIV